MSKPAWVGPSSPAIRIWQSCRILSVLSIVSKKWRPTGTSRDVRISVSSSVRVNLDKNSVMIDCFRAISWLDNNQSGPVDDRTKLSQTALV